MTADEITSVMIAGTGLMGAQIAVHFAMSGLDVVCMVRSHDVGRLRITEAAELLRSATSAEKDSLEEAVGLIRLSSPEQCAETTVDLVLESLPEDFSVKVDVLSRLLHGRDQVFVASNTSSLSITELGIAVGTPSRWVGAHFMNPPLLMPLVEITPRRAHGSSSCAVGC